jgi:hypothetical protein
MNIAVRLPMLIVQPACPEAANRHSIVKALTTGSTCRARGEAAQQLLPPACAAAARLSKHRHNAHHTTARDCVESRTQHIPHTPQFPALVLLAENLLHTACAPGRACTWCFHHDCTVQLL